MQSRYNKIPLAFFAFNRPSHTARSLDALYNCGYKEKFDFFFYSDAAPHKGMASKVEEVRKVLDEKADFFPAEVIKRDNNLGLAKSIVEGVTSLCKKYGCVVVVEDDLEVSPDFLKFMFNALERYSDDEDVMQVAGHTIAPPDDLTKDAFFLPITTTWGWGTWDRAWKHFSWDPENWPDKKNDADWKKLFTVNESNDYIGMLEDRLKNMNDSWGILWWYSVSIRLGKVLYPIVNLVSNFGFDGTGVHCGNKDSSVHSSPKRFALSNGSFSFPDNTTHRIQDFKRLEQFFKSERPTNFSFKKIKFLFKRSDIFLIRGSLKILLNRFMVFLSKFRGIFFKFLIRTLRIIKALSPRSIKAQDSVTIRLCALGEGAGLGPEAVIDNNRFLPEFISIGNNSYCRGRLLLYGHGGQIKIGQYSYVGVRTEIWSMDSITIGDRVLIAHDVNIHDGTAHSLDPCERHEHFINILKTGHPKSWAEVPGLKSSPIVIEDDVWISFGATILKGVKIGARSIISAGAFVTEDVPSDTIYQNKITPTMRQLRKN